MEAWRNGGRRHETTPGWGVNMLRNNYPHFHDQRGQYLPDCHLLIIRKGFDPTTLVPVGRGSAESGISNKGKSKKLALIAVSNKLLQQSFAIAQSGIPYDKIYESVLIMA